MTVLEALGITGSEKLGLLGWRRGPGMPRGHFRSMRLLTTIALLSVAALIGTIGYLAHQYSSERDEAQRRVRHSYAVIDSLQDQFAALTKAEAANRSYLLTGDESYLKPYREAAAWAFSDVARFHQLIAASPLRASVDSHLYELVVAKFEMMERDIEIARQEGLDTGIALVRAKAGDRIMDDLRRETVRLTDKQQGVLLDQERLAAQSEQVAILVVSLSCGLALVGLALAFRAFVVETMRRSRRAHQLMAERQSARHESRSKSALLAYTSHELRTPLNAIIGFSELMLEEHFGKLSAKHKDYLESIRDSGQHLSDLLSDILDLSQLDAGKIELHPEWVDLDKIVSSCLELVTARARAGGVSLKSDVARTLPPVEVDPLRLKQVLINLLTNAVKFTPTGGSVTVTAGRTRSGGIALAVRDTGIGIPKSEMSRVFRPYHRVDNSMTRNREGIGLGLPLTKQLVELHGGQLRLESTEGVGTEVTVVLPRRLVGAEAIAQSRAA
jgi:signal transduction histidine kinase